jgi:hypothetical protein
MADEPRTDQTEPAKVEVKQDTQDKTFTQADLDRVVEERLARERRKYEGFEELKAKAARADELEAANQSEIEKAQSKATKAESERDQAKAQLLRFEVAAEKSVPPKLVPLLTASSKEELESQADLILENAKPDNPDFDGGPRDPAPEAKKPEDAHDDVALALLGLKSNQ